MTTLVWIIGRGGLLGSGLERSLRRNTGYELFEPSNRHWNWDDAESIRTDMKESVAAFALALSGQSAWQIHWAAGRGTMASQPEELAAETGLLASLLGLLTATEKLSSMPGKILFASSAGAIFGDGGGKTVTEKTVAHPSTAYGRAKIEQEGLLTEWAKTQPNTGVLLARFSNIYGPGQSSQKTQGLITHIARAIILHRPVNIFVPFDTIRDYLFVDDAAERAVAMLERIGTGATIGLIASEESTTIAHIIGTFRRITRLNPRIIRSTNALGAAYPRRVQFRSTKRAGGTGRRTALHVGVAQTLAHERSSVLRGS